MSEEDLNFDPDDPAFIAEEEEMERRFDTEPLTVKLEAYIQPGVMERLQICLKDHPIYCLNQIVNEALHSILYDQGY
jgi:hypothetical protein